jgi:metal-responsive CopG/Arc/MetJ family transcriptional regulator
MARPRKSPHLKNQPITISLPPGMIANLDELLSYGANRSRWIQTAIADRLNGTDSVLTPSQAIKFLLDVIENNPNNINPKLLRELYHAIPTELL